LANEFESKGYFHLVAEKTPTQFWINTAVQADLEYFLEQGAVGNTSNPTHIPTAINTDQQVWYPVIDKYIKSTPELTDDEVANLVLQQITIRSLVMFHPLYDQSKGKYGYVAIQGNPFTNENLKTVIEEAKIFSKLGENVGIKIQSTYVGIKAIEELTANGINTICTKGFSVAQGVAMAEAYERGLDNTNTKPICFVVNIAGIFDEYLSKSEEAKGIDPNCIRYAGIAMNRKLYHIFKKRKYRARLLMGGSREPYHFTDLVGGDLGITISPPQAKPLILKNEPVIPKINDKIPKNIIKELNESPDFCKAYYEDKLAPGEFNNFGPCVKFQKSFEMGYLKTLDEIKGRRKLIV